LFTTFRLAFLLCCLAKNSLLLNYAQLLLLAFVQELYKLFVQVER
jgi:hypothetical protein